MIFHPLLFKTTEWRISLADLVMSSAESLSLIGGGGGGRIPYLVEAVPLSITKTFIYSLDAMDTNDKLTWIMSTRPLPHSQRII